MQLVSEYLHPFRSRFFIDAAKIKKFVIVLVMIRNMYVPIYNRFHTRRASSGKIASFRGTLLQRPYSRGTPSPRGTKLRHDKLVFAAAHSEDFVILACTVLIQYSSVTDRRTDRQTPKPWLRRAKHSAIARKNGSDVVRLC